LLFFSADSVRLVEIEDFNKIFKNFSKITHSPEHEKISGKFQSAVTGQWEQIFE